MVIELYDYDYDMMGLVSNYCFVTDAPYLNGDHDYNFTSSVGHPRLDSSGC
jgi:hypothetical protein